MIIFIEGPRESGKTYLMEKFFEKNTNPDIIYYKFFFAKYIKELNLKDHEETPAMHYFSLGNIMTILELNQTYLKDKVLIFDRSIFSAYVWAILRNRLTEDLAWSEFKKIVQNRDLYSDTKVLFVTRGIELPESNRKKDYFDQLVDYETEHKLFGKMFSKFMLEINDASSGNTLNFFSNDFNNESVDLFSEQLYKLINTNK